MHVCRHSQPDPAVGRATVRPAAKTQFAATHFTLKLAMRNPCSHSPSPPTARLCEFICTYADFNHPNSGFTSLPPPLTSRSIVSFTNLALATAATLLLWLLWHLFACNYQIFSKLHILCCPLSIETPLTSMFQATLGTSPASLGHHPCTHAS